MLVLVRAAGVVAPQCVTLLSCLLWDLKDRGFFELLRV